MKANLVRIALVDDHELVREAWRMLLTNYPHFEVVMDCSNGPESVALSAQVKPDIMLVDINMSPMSGFDVAAKMSLEQPRVKLIGLSVSNQPRYAQRMLDLGAKGYLTKTSSLEEITVAILKVYNGETYLCNEIRPLIASLS